MYILNPENIKNATQVSVRTGKFIEKHYNIFAINKCKDGYWFSNTKEFEESLSYLPFWLKFNL